MLGERKWYPWVNDKQEPVSDISLVLWLASKNQKGPRTHTHRNKGHKRATWNDTKNPFYPGGEGGGEQKRATGLRGSSFNLEWLF